MSNDTVRPGLVALCILAGLIVGCEPHGSSRSTVSISPDTVNLPTGIVSTVQFTAGGGNVQYTWTVSKSALGTIRPTAPATAVYQSVAMTNGVNVVTVQDSNGDTANALITQR